MGFRSLTKLSRSNEINTTELIWTFGSAAEQKRPRNVWNPSSHRQRFAKQLEWATTQLTSSSQISPSRTLTWHLWNNVTESSILKKCSSLNDPSSILTELISWWPSRQTHVLFLPQTAYCKFSHCKSSWHGWYRLFAIGRHRLRSSLIIWLVRHLKVC